MYARTASSTASKIVLHEYTGDNLLARLVQQCNQGCFQTDARTCAGTAADVHAMSYMSQAPGDEVGMPVLPEVLKRAMD